MTKQEARKKYRDMRMALSEKEIAFSSVQICMKLIEQNFDFQTVHVFLPIKRLKEIDLGDFIAHCYANEKTVCTSVSDFVNSSMKTVKITAETAFTENEWGIPEPQNGTPLIESEIDLVIIPLLYADSSGNRIGYGKGFYDRFLAKCSKDVLKIGVNYYPSAEPIEDSAETDVQIDRLVIAE